MGLNSVDTHLPMGPAHLAARYTALPYLFLTDAVGSGPADAMNVFILSVEDGVYAWFEGLRDPRFPHFPYGLDVEPDR